MSHTARETAGVTTRLLSAYVRRRAGEEGVAAARAASGVPHALSETADQLLIAAGHARYRARAERGTYRLADEDDTLAPVLVAPGRGTAGR